MRHIARLCFFFLFFFQVHSVTLFRPLSKAECAAFKKNMFFDLLSKQTSGVMKRVFDFHST